MTTFKDFQGKYISGKVAVNKDGTVKIYKSVDMLNKAIEKATKEGFTCKAVKNGKSFSIAMK